MAKPRIEQALAAQSWWYCVGLCFLGLVGTLHYLFWGALEKENGGELNWIVWEWVALIGIGRLGVMVGGVFWKSKKTCFCRHDIKSCMHLDSLPSQDSRSQRRILLVEDTEINRLILRKVLHNLNFRCEEAENGKIAVDYFKQGRTYDLILMDKEMPVMDGHEATRQLRTMGVKTPIVALSGNAMQSDKDLFFKAGVDDFQSKPLSRDKLLQLLVRYGLESSCTKNRMS